MRCSTCGTRPAVIYGTRVVGPLQIGAIHLCAECAAAAAPPTPGAEPAGSDPPLLTADTVGEVDPPVLRDSVAALAAALAAGRGRDPSREAALGVLPDVAAVVLEAAARQGHHLDAATVARLSRWAGGRI